MWTARQVTFSVATLLLLPVGGADARHSNLDLEGPLETLRVSVNLVTIGVRVSDRKSREVSGLQREDFSVFEDGKPQQLAVFASEQQPVSLLMLVDRSYSMGQSGKLDQANSALTQLLENSHPDNEYALVVFDNESIPLLDFPSDRPRIASLLGRLSSDRAGSSLYDSMVLALDRFDRARYPRHVLVVITDGADQHSRLRLDDANAVYVGLLHVALRPWKAISPY